MSGQTFDGMAGVTFADFKPDANVAIEQSFKDDPQVRAECTRCGCVYEGTLERVAQHVESCHAPG